MGLLLGVSVSVDERVGHVVVEATLLLNSVGEETNSGEAGHKEDDPNDDGGSVTHSLYSFDLFGAVLVNEGTVLWIVQVVVVSLVHSNRVRNCRN